MGTLNNKRVLVGITGGIAAYKIPFLIRDLQREGAQVKVMMSETAKAFVTPLTLQALCGEPIYDTIASDNNAAMEHIELARWADVLLIAPASANTLAALAQGVANDVLTTTTLATTAIVAVAPAMNKHMWNNEATQHNLHTLQQRGVLVWGPEAGQQACGDEGMGRMIEPQQLVAQLQTLWQSTLLTGKKVVITAGPTHEHWDPIRYLTNCSSGKMGYALAQAAMEAGASVHLVSGPVSLMPPERVQCYSVTHAQSMLEQVLALMDCDIFIGAAAVADYRPQALLPQKLKTKTDTLTLTLVRNPDIIATVAALPRSPFMVGFAAETHEGMTYAREKLQRKNLDVVLLNDVSEPGQVFGHDCNAITMVTKQREQYFPRQNKSQLAREVIKAISPIFQHDKVVL
ncbi:MAG: bifunctional phosphopantothenoylcysteine decarboxylase/phosphopantothenate--cysteine ligase CoaBC [Gammaproteobacteria bacterium]